jgi:hypothetical protein
MHRKVCSQSHFIIGVLFWFHMQIFSSETVTIFTKNLYGGEGTHGNFDNETSWGIPTSFTTSFLAMSFSMFRATQYYILNDVKYLSCRNSDVQFRENFRGIFASIDSVN